ncbi:MAG: hypothetical protein EP343_06980 [Deltaproteobacteria bacterium]|nr:MAG: hypothetical protein EP343_06980 [Deltaproteobacteria bacterium]
MYRQVCRRIVVVALCVLGLVGCKPSAPTVSELQSDLVKADWLKSRNAAEMLSTYGPNALPVLLQGLKNKEPQVQMLSAEALGPHAKSQDSHPQALPELQQALLPKNNVLVRRRAAEALSMYAAHPIDTDGLILALFESVRIDKDEQVRQYAARALGSLKVSMKNQSVVKTQILPKLQGFLQRQAPLVAVEVGHAMLRLIRQLRVVYKKDEAKDMLKALDEPQRKALGAIVLVLKNNKHPWAQATAAQVLRQANDMSLPAASALMEVLLSSKGEVFHCAASALGAHGHKIFSFLKKLIQSKSAEERRRAVYVYSTMNTHLKEALYEVDHVFKNDKDKSVKQMAKFVRDVLDARKNR